MHYGLAGQPKPEEDNGYNITFAETDETYTYMDRWDRLCVWKDIGAFCLKIFDNDRGLVEAWIDEEAAQDIIEYTGTEPHYRTFMSPQEQAAFRKSQGGEESI